MLMEMIIVAITLVITQTLVGIGLMYICMSEWFIKKVTKRSFKLMKTIEQDLEDWVSEEEA